MLTKYHGNGNPDSVWVQLQLSEYNEHLELDGADKCWYDYRALFRNSASMYRLGCNCAISVYGQWAGNGKLTCFWTNTIGADRGFGKKLLYLIF